LGGEGGGLFGFILLLVDHAKGKEKEIAGEEKREKNTTVRESGEKGKERLKTA